MHVEGFVVVVLSFCVSACYHKGSQTAILHALQFNNAALYVDMITILIAVLIV